MCRSPLYARQFRAVRAVLSIYPKLPRIYVGLRCIANGKVNREKDYRTQKGNKNHTGLKKLKSKIRFNSYKSSTYVTTCKTTLFRESRH